MGKWWGDTDERGGTLVLWGGGAVPVLLSPRQITHRADSDLKAWAMVQASIGNVPSENTDVLSFPVPFLRLSRRISYHRPRHYFSKPPPTYHSEFSFDFIRRYIISQAKTQSIWKVKFDNSTDLLGEPLFRQTSSRFVNLCSFVQHG